MKKFIVTIIIAAIALTFWLYASYSSALKYQLDPKSRESISITIPEGSGGGQIAAILEEKGLIKSPWSFRFYIKQNELDSQLKAGVFVFQKNQNLKEIVDVLIQGGSGETSATLLEGWTAEQMAGYLEQQGLTTRDSFLSCLEQCPISFDFLPDSYLEGFLYPDTYFIDASTYSDEAFINQLVTTFKNKFTPEEWSDLTNSDRPLEEIIIMASIVEREERDSAEKPTVAGILWNRFDIGMGLQADATILYALGRTEGGLSAKDLQIDSPYNTRKYRGLPPTPISNPSIDSIRAALYPAETNYMYYLHDDEGGIHYAESLAGHNENKAKYIN